MMGVEGEVVEGEDKFGQIDKEQSASQGMGRTKIKEIF